jgi:hypothetical protein
MNKILSVFALFALLGLSSCGGGANKDAEAFCNCVKTMDASCDESMEKLEDAFKADPKRLEDFKAAATKLCPDAAKMIDRMD